MGRRREGGVRVVGGAGVGVEREESDGHRYNRHGGVRRERRGEGGGRVGKGGVDDDGGHEEERDGDEGEEEDEEGEEEEEGGEKRGPVWNDGRLEYGSLSIR